MKKFFKRFVITWRNDWKQLSGDSFNWYSFTPILVEFEYDKMTEGISFEIIILGLGFFLRYNLPASDALFKKWHDDAEKEFKKKKRVTKKVKKVNNPYI